jgi:hypothetical protein
MTARFTSTELLSRDEIVAPPAQRACNDRTFELPPVLHAMTALLFLGFVTVLTLTFRTNMSVPYGIIVMFIAAFFAVPTLFVRTKADASGNRAMAWHEFRERGVATHTGRSSARDATVLVLLLPFLVLCFAIAVAAIATFVQ